MHKSSTLRSNRTSLRVHAKAEVFGDLGKGELRVARQVPLRFRPGWARHFNPCPFKSLPLRATTCPLRVATVATPLLAALLGAAVGVGGGVYVADRQIKASRQDVARQSKASRQDVARQIAAARVGWISDSRAETYGEFVSAVDRHLERLGGQSENAVRQADEEIVAAQRLVDLRGSRAASVEAAAISSRARKLTNAAIRAIQAERRNQVPTEPFFAQQKVLDRFVRQVQPELRR